MPNGTKRTPIQVMRVLDTLGATVAPMPGKAGAPNLLVGYEDATHVFFLNPRGKLTAPQKKWARSWEGAEPAVICDVEGLLDNLKVPAKERQAILQEGDATMRKAFALAARRKTAKRGRTPAKKTPAKRAPGRGRRGPGRPAGRGRRASASSVNSTEPSTSAQA